jgi:hypothetical protein
MDSDAHRLARGRGAILTQFRPDVLYMYAKVDEKFHSKSERVTPVQYRAVLYRRAIFRSCIAGKC